jgi:hypothetical protein
MHDNVRRIKFGTHVKGVGHRPRMFESRVLRKILGPKRDEVTGRLEEITL